MKDFFDDFEDDDDIFPRYEAECQGCDMWGLVDDIGLCEDCAEKLDRDMIRKRDWAYSASAFGCPENKLEDLRNEVIKRYGSKLELIAEDKPRKKKRKKNRRSRRKKK
ncbi:conserved hypothetical protein [delta proteobacterium NaphS2]|nr:conserved hypothetical protein [delta proteobacterium NaphS2]